MNKKIVLGLWLLLSQTASADWFDDLKAPGNAEDLYRALYYMPKGGDLHNHLSGAAFPGWWYDAALAEKERGYEYYTKVRIENCRDYGGNEYGGLAYYLMFRNIMASQYEQLSDCEQREYKRLENLTEHEKAAWMDSIRLDKPHEGRDEFFQTHWQRLFALVRNPWLQAEILYRNMRAFGEEGVTYIEFQVAVGGFQRPDGSLIPPIETADILRERLRQKDAIDTGVTVRFQIAILRFLPNAEDELRRVYKFVHDNSDVFVAVNMVGREDDDKGYPLRFLPTMRDLRRQYSGVNLSIHAGEVDEPNSHVRDTLLLGADRIGHGLNPDRRRRHDAPHAARSVPGGNQPDQQLIASLHRRLCTPSISRVPADRHPRGTIHRRPGHVGLDDDGRILRRGNRVQPHLGRDQAAQPKFPFSRICHTGTEAGITREIRLGYKSIRARNASFRNCEAWSNAGHAALHLHVL